MVAGIEKVEEERGVCMIDRILGKVDKHKVYLLGLLLGLLVSLYYVYSYASIMDKYFSESFGWREAYLGCMEEKSLLVKWVNASNSGGWNGSE